MRAVVVIAAHDAAAALPALLRSLDAQTAGRDAFERFRRRMDYSEYGGALLLGVAGLVVVAHGRSSPRAMRNAIAMAARYAGGDFVSRVERDIAAATVS